MDDNEISPYITMTKVRSGEKLQIEQKYVKIREGQNKLMAVSYQAPIYEIVELERFFEDFAHITPILELTTVVDMLK